MNIKNMKRLLFLVLCIMVFAQSDVTAQNYTDYYKGDTIIRANDNTYYIVFAQIINSSIVYMQVANIDNVKNVIEGPLQTFILQDRKIFCDVVKEVFTQEELKAMYKELKASPNFEKYFKWNTLFEFAFNVNRHTERIGKFEFCFFATPATRNISPEKIERMENMLRKRVKFNIYEGRRQFLNSYDFFRHDAVSIHFREVIDNFDSLCKE